MTLPIKYWHAPFDVVGLKDQIDRLFDGFPGLLGDRDLGIMEGIWSPAIDIYDSKDNLLIRADVPGMTKEDIDVTVHNNVLTVRGEKKKETETKSKGFIRQERFSGSFNRSVSLPSEVDASKVKATYKEGVLEIVLPKREEAKPKQIKVDIT